MSTISSCTSAMLLTCRELSRMRWEDRSTKLYCHRGFEEDFERAKVKGRMTSLTRKAVLYIVRWTE